MALLTRSGIYGGNPEHYLDSSLKWLNFWLGSIPRTVIRKHNMSLGYKVTIVEIYFQIKLSSTRSNNIQLATKMKRLSDIKRAGEMQKRETCWKHDDLSKYNLNSNLKTKELFKTSWHCNYVQLLWSSWNLSNLIQISVDPSLYFSIPNSVLAKPPLHFIIKSPWFQLNLSTPWSYTQLAD